MVFVFLEGYASGVPSYTTCLDANLKWGITSRANYLSRYSQDFLADKKMIQIATGNRAEMAAMERVLTERVPGPLNLEPWAGSEFGNDMGVLETILGGTG